MRKIQQVIKFYGDFEKILASQGLNLSRSFPIFFGGDPAVWITEIEQCLDENGVPAEYWFSVGVEWIQIWREIQPCHSWSDLKDELTKESVVEEKHAGKTKGTKVNDGQEERGISEEPEVEGEPVEEEIVAAEIEMKSGEKMAEEEEEKKIEVAEMEIQKKIGEEIQELEDEDAVVEDEGEIAENGIVGKAAGVEKTARVCVSKDPKKKMELGLSNFNCFQAQSRILRDAQKRKYYQLTQPSEHCKQIYGPGLVSPSPPFISLTPPGQIH